MGDFLLDWLNLLIRWAHLIAGVGWIGTSFYFIALDLSLRKREAMNPGVTGTAWEVHGGGFYHVEKYAVAPAALPEDLIWFKWEAYLTWVSGFALMVVQFYFNPSAWLIDPEIMALMPWQAIAISVASLIVGWFAYDIICRSPIGTQPVLLAVVVFALILGVSWGYTHVFSGRSALIHVGAFIGTIMAVNVFGVIIPNQKKVTAALLAGEAPDPKYGVIGKQRSVHNTYLTLPVLVMMVSGHYPMLTGHPHAWMLVGLIIIGGGCARHFLVQHEVGTPLRAIAWTVPVVLFALLAAIWLSAPAPVDSIAQVDDAEVLTITAKHCANCHAKQPTQAGFSAAPKNVILQTTDDLRRYAPLIEQHAVRTRTMPLGNMTGMSADERQRLGAWLAAQ